MIELPHEIEKCTCTKNKTSHKSCQNDHTLIERGQAVTFKVRKNEKLKTIVIDDCVMKNKSSKRCDGMFIFKNKKSTLYSFLVELKNSSEIEKAVLQLSETTKSIQYTGLMEKLKICERNQKFVIVSSPINKFKLEKIRKECNIGIIIVMRKATEPYHNLRKYI
ncbi:MAG: hypothetical protein JJV95_02505 [Sulfurospirillum sp.]|nr:hypothetical protein [Sulfurospirillum sp.]MBL0702843.1 hypothetical protein [Sulfurospirillum sp.]